MLGFCKIETENIASTAIALALTQSCDSKSINWINIQENNLKQSPSSNTWWIIPQIITLITQSTASDNG